MRRQYSAWAKAALYNYILVCACNTGGALPLCSGGLAGHSGGQGWLSRQEGAWGVELGAGCGVQVIIMESGVGLSQCHKPQTWLKVHQRSWGLLEEVHVRVDCDSTAVLSIQCPNASGSTTIQGKGFRPEYIGCRFIWSIHTPHGQELPLDGLSQGQGVVYRLLSGSLGWACCSVMGPFVKGNPGLM
jgi:hypothetical protein